MNTKLIRFARVNMSSEISSLQSKIKELEASIEQYQETEITLQCDNDNLTRKLARAETEIYDLEKTEKELLIALNKSKNELSRLKSKPDASDEKLEPGIPQIAIETEEKQNEKQKRLAIANSKLIHRITTLAQDFAAKESAWKQKENELKLKLAAKTKALEQAQNEIASLKRPNAGCKRKLSGEGSTASNKKQRIKDPSNPHGFPPGCQWGPFGVLTVVNNDRRLFLNKDSVSGKLSWVRTPPKLPQSWVIKEFPGAEDLPRMNAVQRRIYEAHALQMLRVIDLKEILRKKSLSVVGLKKELIDRVKAHLNALYEDRS